MTRIIKSEQYLRSDDIISEFSFAPGGVTEPSLGAGSLSPYSPQSSYPHPQIAQLRIGQL